MGTYYFHIRDSFGVVEDTDGVELPGMAALIAEVIRSVDELSRERSTHRSVRFEIADSNGRTVLVAPVQGSISSLDLMAELPVTHLSIQWDPGLWSTDSLTWPGFRTKCIESQLQDRRRG